MSHCWVSQNKTFTHEVGGGCFGSINSNNRGKRVAAYDFMTENQSGAVVFSFANTDVLLEAWPMVKLLRGRCRVVV